MIFYFSGTGNSAKVAGMLGAKLEEDLMPVSNLIATADLVTGKTIGIVFPVHAWGPALPVMKFIDDMEDAFIERIRREQIPVWVVMTCGDETGEAPRIIENRLRGRGLGVSGIWSVIMPNTYVLLPGFDVDDKETESMKLLQKDERVNHIASRIRGEKWERDFTAGSMPRIKTRLVYPLFRRWGINPSRWKATDECISCGKCSQVCPEENIKMEDGKPGWGRNCVSCLACYHVCPRHAVEYGNVTASKGQYRTLIP